MTQNHIQKCRDTVARIHVAVLPNNTTDTFLAALPIHVAIYKSHVCLSVCLRPGIVFILLSLVVTGLLLTILVVMASRAWRNFGKR